MSVKSILIVGVGGQGTLLSSRLLGKAMLSMGYDVKISEVHGMSQRGGSVMTYVRYGEKVSSPIIEKGEADIILSFEQLETARYLPYLKKGGTVVTNTQKTEPMSVIAGAEAYPENLIEKISDMGVNIIAFDALEIAEKAGSVKAVNVALIGRLARLLDVPYDVWTETIRSTVPAKFADLNLKAFELSYNL